MDVSVFRYRGEESREDEQLPYLQKTAILAKRKGTVRKNESERGSFLKERGKSIRRARYSGRW